MQPTHIIQQQNFIPQQIIPHSVPMQIIQQTPLNIPPPMRAAAPIVQFQGQPTNIQVQGGQQILLNQGPGQQYQLQYIQSPNQQQMQTIQHVIQPQHQMQILQPGANGQQFITVQGNTASFMMPPPNIIQQNPQQNINQVFNQQQTIALNQEDMKNDANKMKQDGDKANLSQQQIARIVTSIPLNQPPPVLNCPPPQIFNQQQGQQVQQFIVNTNPWPQQQQIQQLPLNSQIQIVAQPQALRSGNEIVIQNPLQAGQQVITTFNPQQGGQQFQQIQFHQAVTQPPPPPQVPTSHQNMSYQQQFEQKIIYVSSIFNANRKTS